MKKYLLPGIIILAGIALIGYRYLASGSINNLELKIESTPLLMPSCYKVYGNPEAASGQHYLFKMMMTNNGSSPIQGVKVSYTIPKYIEKTELAKVPVINPGQSVVLACYPAFNDDVVEKTTSSKEKVKIEIESKGGSTEKEFAFEMKGRNEFVYSSLPSDEIRSYSDMFDNDNLLACLVTPEDPIVKYYTQQIQEKLLKGEVTIENNPNEGVRFLMGIYNATYLSHMVYSGTAGVPEKFDDATTSMVQNIRLPRELITGNTGLCIELSILYASVMMSAGMNPVIYLIPGHAYPGFRMAGQYFALEATAIGGENLQGGRKSAEEAFKAGMKNRDEFFQAAQMGDDRFNLIDIRQLVSEQIKPMELKDDAFLRQKVDQIAASWASGGVSIPENIQYQPEQLTGGGGGNSGGGGGGGGGGNSGSNMPVYSGPVSFNYPRGWSRINRPSPQLPQLITQFISPDQTATLQVYQIPGANDGYAALQMLEQPLYMLGSQIQYQAAGNVGSFQVFNGITQSANGTMSWQAYLKRTNNGVAGLILGDAGGTGAYNGVFNQVLQTLR